MSQSGVSSAAAEKRGGTSHPSGPGDGDGSGCRSLGTEQATRSAQTNAHLRQRAEKDPNRRKGPATLETFMNLCRTRRDIPAAAAFAEGGPCPLEPTRMRALVSNHFSYRRCPSLEIGTHRVPCLILQYASYGRRLIRVRHRCGGRDP